MTTAKVLSDKKIRPSMLRIRLLDYLRSVKTHPTADEIYDALSGEIPTLSKTSVYNTMKLFVEADLSKLITIEGQQVRFDGDTSLHGHFLCSHCKKVFDFSIDILAASDLEGFDIQQKEVYYSGICKNCLERK